MTQRWTSLIVGILLGGLSLYGQVNATGTIEGTVSDKSGAVVPNADVKLASRDTGLAREAKSNAAGQYRFELLPTGTYQVRVTVPGFANATYETVGVAVSQTTTVAVRLSPRAQAETVTVESTSAPLVDTTRTDVS